MLGADMAKALKPASASPNKIQLRSLFMFPSFFCAIPLPRPDTLGTEKKSGVPYILTSQGRHRQTPLCKHDQKTRHVGLAHVAQPSYSAFRFLTLAKFHIKRHTLLRTLLGAFRAYPAPRLWLLNGRDARSPSAPRFCPCLGGTTPPRWRLSIRSQQVATLPWFRAGGGSVFAAQSRHEEPSPPMSKINPTIPFTIPFKGMQGKYTPFPRRFQAGNAVFGSLQAY